MAPGILLAMVAVTVFIVWAGHKSYRFPEVAVDATVLPDGSLRLEEERTFDFRGEFGFAFFTVDWPFEQVRDFTITEDGVPVPVEAESDVGDFKATWRFRAEDERRTFTISYRAVCAVRAYDAAAHLLWQFVGTGWDVPTDSARVTVHLPGTAARDLERPLWCDTAAPVPEVRTTPLGPGDTRAWGHGPLGGEVRIVDPHTVELSVEDLPPHTFVEGSVLFPPRSVPLAPLSSGSGAEVLAEEARLAQEANLERERLLAERRRLARWRVVGWSVAAGIPLAILLLVVVARRRDRVPGVPRILQEPPEEIHPADLATLWGRSRGAPRPRDVYRAQLLHLAGSGVIELRGVGRVTEPDDLQVRLIALPEEKGLDMAFAEFLFATGGEWVSLQDLRPEGKRRKELREWWDDVGSSTRTGAAQMGQGRPEGAGVWVLGIGGIVAAFGLGAVAGPVAVAVGLGAPAAMIAGLIAMPRRAPPALRERVARWSAFRRFLKRFSSLSGAPALAVVIWERYLAYAAALGVAENVERQVRALVPEQELPAPWPGAPQGVGGLAWVDSLHGASTPSVAAAAVSSTSSWSSSSDIGSFSSGGGFGGGFSGGGGGGGGGTGGGAG